jgi:2',3'-cyclic-nucleotide 2'-phosphodiesterase (5'-nucleotidase family)
LAKEDKKESELANLFTNLLHQAVPEADFAILNPGGFRTEWVPGVIQYQHFYNMNPFENEIQTF